MDEHASHILGKVVDILACRKTTSSSALDEYNSQGTDDDGYNNTS